MVIFMSSDWIDVNVKPQLSAPGLMMSSCYIIGVLVLIAAVGVVLRCYPSNFGINNRLPFSFCDEDDRSDAQPHASAKCSGGSVLFSLRWAWSSPAQIPAERFRPRRHRKYGNSQGTPEFIKALIKRPRLKCILDWRHHAGCNPHAY